MVVLKSCLGVSGSVWERLGVSGSVWERPGAPGDVWECFPEVLPLCILSANCTWLCRALSPTLPPTCFQRHLPLCIVSASCAWFAKILFGSVWDLGALGTSGNVWERLAASGSVWKCLGTFSEATHLVYNCIWQWLC